MALLGTVAVSCQKITDIEVSAACTTVTNNNN